MVVVRNVSIAAFKNYSFDVVKQIPARKIFQSKNSFSVSNDMKEPLQCSKCNKVFAGRASLKKHMEFHTGQFTAYCDMCKKGFNNKGHYRDHMRKHEGLKYNCEFCSKAFASKQRLLGHLSVHTGVYRFTCDICNKGFNDKPVFEKHLKLHS